MKFQLAKTAAEAIEQMPDDAADSLRFVLEQIRDAKSMSELHIARPLRAGAYAEPSIYEIRRGHTRTILSLATDRGEPNVTILSVEPGQARTSGLSFGR